MPDVLLAAFLVIVSLVDLKFVVIVDWTVGFSMVSSLGWLLAILNP